MYSKLKLLGHPIHPMLVAFPIALYTSALAGYLVYAWLGDPFWFQLGFVANVAGVLAALVTAVPGFLDWWLGIPQETPAKNTGLLHLILNVTALVLFAASAWLLWSQWTAAAPDATWGILLSAVGFILTSAAGYLGFEMIQRHHVGVDLTPEQRRLEPTSEQQPRRPTGAYRQV